MKFQDYYEVLGVPRTATTDEIKAAYRKLAMKWHPDRYKGTDKKGAEDTFKRMNEAYEVLSDPEKRKKFDAFGEHWRHGEDFTPPPGARGQRMSQEEFEQMFGGGDFSDFFTSIFGGGAGGGGRRTGRGGARRSQPRPPADDGDVRAELAVGIGDAIRGGKHQFRIEAPSMCARCSGSGVSARGRCPACGGMGQTSQSRTVEVAIPKGTADGAQLRLRGLGNPSEDGTPGDLYLNIRLVADDDYRMRGDDIEADVPITPWEAIEGTRVDVRTPSGLVTLTIPPGTKAGARLRIRGMGLDGARKPAGDFFAVVRLALPETLTPRQRELLVEAGRASKGGAAGGARE